MLAGTDSHHSVSVHQETPDVTLTVSNCYRPGGVDV
ncbi:hypothetical protein SBDP1_690004 [Syntrophobacter sp. SbD1]|nr:hypothetical protein SBDP1_690004 [Syntrophobacter sp. SbD1]